MHFTAIQPSRVRRLERQGQLRLDFRVRRARSSERHASELVLDELKAKLHRLESESFEEAIEHTFPERPLTEQELYEEFLRLFPLDNE